MDLVELSKDGGPWSLLGLGALIVRHLHAQTKRQESELERLRKELRAAKRAHLRDLRDLRRRRESELPPS